MMNKVAEITVYFWIMKILATTLGETSGDMLSMTLGAGYVTSLCIMGVILLLLVACQVKSRQFHAPLFWATIIGTTTVGTEISDAMDRTLELGYIVGSLLLFTCLLLTLALWYYKEKDISVYPITRKRPEIFFWVAVLFSNSLGTAFGDFLVDNVGLSYMQGAMVTSFVIGVVLLLHYTTRMNQTLLFWVAFVFTRPFGATFGDLLTKPLEKGGLALGTIQASAVTLIFLVMIGWLAYRQNPENKRKA